MDRWRDIVADDEDDRFFGIDSYHPEIDQWGLGFCFGKSQSRNLGKVGNFHANLVDHTCVQDLGLEINTAAFLTGMGDRKELGDLSLKILQHSLEITQLLRFNAADKPGNRCFDIDGVPSGIEPEVCTAGPDGVRNKLPCMADMGCRADTCREKDEA
jgi:hypothetical protein